MKTSTADANSKQWVQGFKLCFTDDEFKAHILLCTLPPSMDNIVNNLRTKDPLSYSDMRTQILNVGTDSSAGSALISTKKPQQKKNNKKSNSSSSSTSSTRPGIPPIDDCSWCWKRFLPSKGHKHSNCAALKKFQDEKNKASSSSTGSAKLSAATDDVSTGYALMSSHHSTSLPTSMNAVSSPSMATSTSTGTAYKTTEEVWTFDCAASHHIVADLSCLTDPTLDSTGIKVGSGHIVHATHKGTVKLDVVWNGVVTSFSLSNVLYIPSWTESPLISWKQIAWKCRMEAEDEWIRITLKNGNHLFTARAIGPNLYELPVQVKRAQALSSTAVHFWHEALGHSSPQTWTHASDRYPDSHLIPPRPQ